MSAPSESAAPHSSTELLAEVSIRELDAADGVAYNALLRTAVETHPDSFRIAVADILAVPFSTARTEDATTLAAVRADGTWVGVGRALLRAAVDRARAMPGVTKVNLTVAAHNERAIRLYSSEGFHVFSREENAFIDSQPRAELSLSLSLR